MYAFKISKQVLRNRMNEQERSERKIQEFREKIQALKRKLLDNSVYTTQDNRKLNEVKQRMSELYELLYPVLRKKQTPSAIQSENLKEYMNDIFKDIDNENLDILLLDDLHYYAYRDLIMFPLTLDTVRINSLPATNSLKNIHFE